MISDNSLSQSTVILIGNNHPIQNHNQPQSACERFSYCGLVFLCAGLSVLIHGLVRFSQDKPSANVDDCMEISLATGILLFSCFLFYKKAVEPLYNC